MNWHEAAQAAMETEPLLGAKALGLMLGYDARWRDQQYQTLATEEEMAVPLVNPATGAASRTYQFAVKTDGIIEFQGRRYLLEHKTTSDEIADPAATYWRRLAIDSQVSAYMLTHWLGADRLDGTVYDVIRKPSIRPKSIPKKSKEGVGDQLEVLGESYCGFPLAEAQIEAAEANDWNETPDLFALRLAADAVANPDKYFQRRVINRLDNEIVEFAHELWDMAVTIREARNRKAHYRNSDACVLYNSPCEFLPLCSNADTLDSDRWARRESVHGEYEAALGAETLTNSRIRCFQTCRRKHYYRYELGIERADEEEREALRFGSLFHSVLAAWWDQYRVNPSLEGSNIMKEKDNGNCDNAANEVACGAASESD